MRKVTREVKIAPGVVAIETNNIFIDFLKHKQRQIKFWFRWNFVLKKRRKNNDWQRFFIPHDNRTLH